VSLTCFLSPHPKSLCRWMVPSEKTVDDLGWKELLLAGGLSGIAGWVCIYPIDVVKTKMQAESPGGNKRGEKKKKKKNFFFDKKGKKNSIQAHGRLLSEELPGARSSHIWNRLGRDDFEGVPDQRGHPVYLHHLHEIAPTGITSFSNINFLLNRSS